MTSNIGDYAVIGDGRTCALVAKNGSIDFLCWPRFDSEACCAALLRDDRHGYFRLAPSGFVSQAQRRYREDSAILETEHMTQTGRVRVIDCMPWGEGSSAIIRIVEGLDGEVGMGLALRLKFRYGQVKRWAQKHERSVEFEVGPDRVDLDCPFGVDLEAGDVTARFRVSRGERVAIVLTHSSSVAAKPSPLEPEALVQDTEKAWRQWIGRYEARGRWDTAIKRSLITLRLLTDRDSGGMAAAATFGLPEVPGGATNWDYRYCWLRDSTFTLTALLNAGFHEEARRWRDWMLRAVAGQPAALQIVYRIDGGSRLPEHEIDGLPGYQGASPVRIGNAASGQTQLDVFGELVDSFDVLAKAGIARTPRVVEIETAIVERLEKVWDQPSADIWENRDEQRRYTYSQVMAWVALDRFVRAHVQNPTVDRALIGRLKSLTGVIHRTVCERGYSNELGHFVSHFGGEALDASLLLLPLVGFLPANDPRVVGTISAIERHLMQGGLVRRKPSRRGEGEEGASRLLLLAGGLLQDAGPRGRSRGVAGACARRRQRRRPAQRGIRRRKPYTARQHPPSADASRRREYGPVPLRAGHPESGRMRARRVLALALAALASLSLSGCGVLHSSVVNHAGPVAASQWRLYLIVGAVLVFVAAPVLLLTPLVAWHYRLSNKHHAFRPKWSFSWWLEGLIWLPPIGIVIGLAFVLWNFTHALDPYRAIASDQPPLEIDAAAFDWKWLFIYPNQRIAVLNRLVLPVGRPIHLHLTSGTVMQSLLIPQLAGQIYAMAGMTTQLYLEASRPGSFRGENAQYIGDGFQNEKFDAVAMPSSAFEAWTSKVSASIHPLDEAAFQALFKKSSPAAPVYFSSIPPDLFKKILTTSREPPK